MQPIVRTIVAFGLLCIFEHGSFSSETEPKAMTQKESGQHFGQLIFQIPSGFKQASDIQEKITSPIPGGKPILESFRSYQGEAGEGIYFFHWDGFPPRDRGPMVTEQTWEIVVAGQKASVSQTSMFFGVQQRVLTAHFEGKNGHRYLIYMKTADPKIAPDRTRFLAILDTIRFE
jgi:hypothetical protein